MDLRQLAAVVAVADHGSFSAAARALHTVQSNVSAHVARLEAELDVTLIDRGRGSLTEEGTALVERARRIQAEVDALAADVASVRDTVSGTARLGMIGTTGRWLVPPLVDAMGRDLPAVRLVIIDATTSSLIPQLTNGRLELAVVSLPIDDRDIDIEPLFEEDQLVIAPIDHPLAAHDRITVADLGDHELLLQPRGTVHRDELDADAAAVGVELRSRAEVDGMRLLASLAFRGFGAAVLPASAAPEWLGGDWRRVPVDGLARRAVGLARLRRGLPSAPARALREVVRQVIAEEAPGRTGLHPTLDG